MNEYWLMLCFVSLGAGFSWVFFRRLARLALWSGRPKLDTWRYCLITFCLAIVIGNTFEVWEAALMVVVSLFAYRAIQRDRVRFETAMQIWKARPHSLTEARINNYRSGHKS